MCGRKNASASVSIRKLICSLRLGNGSCVVGRSRLHAVAGVDASGPNRAGPGHFVLVVFEFLS